MVEGSINKMFFLNVFLEIFLTIFKEIKIKIAIFLN
jgi:hypothetical protein